MHTDWSEVGTLFNEPEAEARHNVREPEGDDMNDERVKRLRDALSNLVIQDAHTDECAATYGDMPPKACTCGYIERLSIARTALAADADEGEIKPQPDLLAMEHAARLCEIEAGQWSEQGKRAHAAENDLAHSRLIEREHAASQCARSIRRQLAQYPVPVNRMGSEADLATRWRSLLYAESRLQAQRDEILDTIETSAATSLREGVPDGVAMDVPEQVLKMHAAIHAAVATVLDDQVSRPSPDFRALLINTRTQIEAMRIAIPPPFNEAAPTTTFTKAEADAARAGLKEALRLTDVERLAAWPPWTLAGIALRHVVDGLIDELSREHSAQDMDDVWFTETLHDLRDARGNPDAYLQRKQTRTPTGEQS
jgi:hypothetical protein